MQVIYFADVQTKPVELNLKTTELFLSLCLCSKLRTWLSTHPNSENTCQAILRTCFKIDYKLIIICFLFDKQETFNLWKVFLSIFSLSHTRDEYQLLLLSDIWNSQRSRPKTVSPIPPLCCFLLKEKKRKGGGGVVEVNRQMPILSTSCSCGTCRGKPMTWVGALVSGSHLK